MQKKEKKKKEVVGCSGKKVDERRDGGDNLRAASLSSLISRIAVAVQSMLIAT